ncbi:L-fucose:H+ symporter permease [Salinimonas profundi]|uniref:L-fucose:H+ symporter permease n=1 Tax=Salinimonas profundi TaxID=2729140 RepID=UPI001CC30801|nr:L-fucose:H+ symporter permease [Salinimonas profundi]
MNNTAPALIPAGNRIQFILLALCFAAWGTAANMTDPLVSVFSKTFSMSALQSALVQFSYYGAYFCLAIPAALINKVFSFKTGMLMGLGMACTGAFLFYPASQAMTYGYFLAALFILAGGLSILETSANPYVMKLGSEATATRRLNLAQAFNPLGTNLGVFLAATLILPNLSSANAAARATMNQMQLNEVVSAELNAVMTPYVGMAGFLALLWIAFALCRPGVSSAHSEKALVTESMGRLLRLPHYRFGVAAQFFNVGAQTCMWTFTIQYVMKALSADEVTGGHVLQYSMILFLISRFVMTWLMGRYSPSRLLALMSATAIALCLVVIMSLNVTGVIALILVSGCLSLMFPTIYALSLHGLGDDAKLGAAGLVMAILGGALFPMLQAYVMDTSGVGTSFIIPAGCFAFITTYACYIIKTQGNVSVTHNEKRT